MMSSQQAPPMAVAGGAIAMLEESNPEIKAFALKKLYTRIDECWAEAANAVALIEELSEDMSFAGHELAAAVASKIFFHLEEYNESLRLALGAGSYLDLSARDEYADTLVSRCFDEYVRASVQGESLDPRLESIVERIFARCYEEGAYEHAVGVAMEAQRLDKLRDALMNCPPSKRGKLLQYTLEAAETFSHRDFRSKVTRLLVELESSLDAPDYVLLCHCLQALNAADDMINTLSNLVASPDSKDELLAYQLAFLLVESGNQKFIHDVVDRLGSNRTPTQESPTIQNQDDIEMTDAHISPTNSPIIETPEQLAKLQKVRSILDVEGIYSELQLNFLFEKSQADVLVVKQLKEAVDGNRNSVLHNAVVIAHGFMNAGTTNTSFLSENLEWMGKASNWAKFTATASIGVVHMGHIAQSIQLLQPYLPNGGVSSSPYSEGGALYALGLVHANRGGLGLASSVSVSGEANIEENDSVGPGSKSKAAIEYLSDALRNASNVEPLQHGACLGMGLAAMGTGDERLYEELKTILFFDSAVAGEAAAYGIGLLLAGHGCSDESPLAQAAVTELLNYARETAHEKIIRGLVLAVAIIVFGQEEAADSVIEQLCRDRDAIVRYGGTYAIGLAYAGTANNTAVRRLLHVAVSDVNDDVRRAAVTNLGFLLFRQPEKVPTLVSLLAESFNPHVRYGACLAVGIACAGSGDTAALALIEPMLSDQVDFVRQGALLASALLYMQQSEFAAPGVKPFREKIASIVKDKYPSTLTKLGAILAAGVLDAGGRNCSIELQTKSGGFTKPAACIGLSLWCQHWFWYPMHHFFSLALTPSMLVGLNKNFKLPASFQVHCATSPAHFAYPPKLKTKKEVKKERVVTAILSTTLKQQARDKAKLAEKEAKEGIQNTTDEEKASQPMDTEESSTALADNCSSGAVETNTAVVPSADKSARRSQKSYSLTNPSRVTKAQQRFCSFDLGLRYVPAASTLKPSGVVMLIDRQPEEPDDSTPILAPPVNGNDDEAPMPEPFEWTPPSSSSSSSAPSAMVD